MCWYVCEYLSASSQQSHCVTRKVASTSVRCSDYILESEMIVYNIYGNTKDREKTSIVFKN